MSFFAPKNTRLSASGSAFNIMAGRREREREREQEMLQDDRSEAPSLVQMMKSLIPVLPCATVSTALLGWILFYLTCRYKVLDEQTFILGSFHSRLQVYKVLSYMFIHKSMSALVCNVAMLWYFGGAMERDIGTVKFAYLTLLLAILAGIIYLMIGSIIFGLDNLKGIQGFTVVVFSFVGLSVSLSPMKSVVFITTIKVIYLPFILLALSLFIPESSILGNICGIGAGVLYAYGRPFVPYLDMTETTAVSMERYFPFNNLKNLPGITFYSALWEVRNVEVTDRCKPKPGSYPTQTYYFPPSTGPQSCHYSGNLNDPIHLYGYERQQRLGYNLEHIPGFETDAGRASGHGHSHDITHPSGHVFSHDLRQTFGHGNSHNVGHLSAQGLGHEHGLVSGHGHYHDASGHGHSHGVGIYGHARDLGCGHDLGHISGQGYSHKLEHNPEQGHTCDHKLDYQYPGEGHYNSPGIDQSFKSPAPKQFEDSCSVVMN